MLVRVRHRRKGQPWGEWRDVNVAHLQSWVLGALQFTREGTFTVKAEHGQYQWKVISK